MMPMSAIGTKQTCRVALHMSAFGVNAILHIIKLNYLPPTFLSSACRTPS